MSKLPTFFFNLKNRHFFLIDAVGFFFLPLIAIAIRLDGNVDLDQYGFGLFSVMVIFPPIKLVIFYFSGMYQRYWRYASIDEVAYIAFVTGLAIVVQTLIFILLYNIEFLSIDTIPRSVPVIDGILTFLIVGGTRFSVRLVERLSERSNLKAGDRVIVVGAGKSGVSLVSEMQRYPEHRLNPVAFIDDDPKKQQLHIRGLSVVGDRSRISAAVRHYKANRVIIAMPTASGKDIREILEICKQSNVKVSTLPSIFEIINGKVRLESVRDIHIEDLLRREPVRTDIQKVARMIKGKRVLITGAGGSIGSEVCRQIAAFNPSEIVLLGHGENTIFEIEQELRHNIGIHLHKETAGENFPRITPYISDIRSSSRLKILFDKLKPDVIFHTAAHKHVPLMEDNVAEAVSNNIAGTRNLLFLAVRYDVKHFVMISTDKAVNPSSIMGASKRVAEILLLQAAQRSGNNYVCVRFGNVLGSRGSVIPTFKQQIAQGGPVRVTHPEVQRYFMTTQEAVQLVLQASVLGKGGEIFVLDMGRPIKIVDLARDLIRLSGYESDDEIKIEFSGLRPGEKLFEELFIPGEEYVKTEHEKILIAQNASHIIPIDLDAKIEKLTAAAIRSDGDTIREIFADLLPEYRNHGQGVLDTLV
jgi:FlaA1/EpsC-like NDP-sugar epimerase